MTLASMYGAYRVLLRYFDESTSLLGALGIALALVAIELYFLLRMWWRTPMRQAVRVGGGPTRPSSKMKGSRARDVHEADAVSKGPCDDMVVAASSSSSSGVGSAQEDDDSRSSDDGAEHVGIVEEAASQVTEGDDGHGGRLRKRR